MDNQKYVVASILMLTIIGGLLALNPSIFAQAQSEGGVDCFINNLGPRDWITLNHYIDEIVERLEGGVGGYLSALQGLHDPHEVDERIIDDFSRAGLDADPTSRANEIINCLNDINFFAEGQ